MDPNNNDALSLLAEICSALPYLAVTKPNPLQQQQQQQRQPNKRSASSAALTKIDNKKKRTKLNISLETLYDVAKQEFASSETTLAEPLKLNC